MQMMTSLVFSYLHMVTAWHCPHSPTAHRRCIHWSISPACRAHSRKPAAAGVHSCWDGQTPYPSLHCVGSPAIVLWRAAVIRDVVGVKCVDASMTVNSKEALKVVMGMFNESSSSADHNGYPYEDPNFEQQFALDTSQLVCLLLDTHMNGHHHS